MVDEKPAEAVPVKRRSILGIMVKIAIMLLIVVAGIIGMAATQPDEFRIVRTATIAAPPAEVFPQVSDFHNWEHWSPWAKLDPNAKNTFEGPATGEGAIFSWDGNDKVGAGRMTVLESRPNEVLKIKLEFTRPMEDTSTTTFDFKPEGDKTVVTDLVDGRSPSESDRQDNLHVDEHGQSCRRPVRNRADKLEIHCRNEPKVLSPAACSNVIAVASRSSWEPTYRVEFLG